MPEQFRPSASMAGARICFEVFAEVLIARDPELSEALIQGLIRALVRLSSQSDAPPGADAMLRELLGHLGERFPRAPIA